MKFTMLFSSGKKNLAPIIEFLNIMHYNFSFLYVFYVKLESVILTLSRQRPISYRKKFTDLQSKSVD